MDKESSETITFKNVKERFTRLDRAYNDFLSTQEVYNYENSVFFNANNDLITDVERDVKFLIEERKQFNRRLGNFLELFKKRNHPKRYKHLEDIDKNYFRSLDNKFYQIEGKLPDDFPGFDDIPKFLKTYEEYLDAYQEFMNAVSLYEEEVDKMLQELGREEVLKYNIWKEYLYNPDKLKEALDVYQEKVETILE